MPDERDGIEQSTTITDFCYLKPQLMKGDPSSTQASSYIGEALSVPASTPDRRTGGVLPHC